MAGFWGSHMGLIDLLLEQDGGKWRVASSETERPPDLRAQRGPQRHAARRRLSPRRSTPTAAAHEATLAYVRAEVGESTAPLQSYFALVADDPSVQIVSQAQTWYVSRLLEGHRVGRACPSSPRPRRSRPGGRGGPDYYTDVPAGPVAIKNVADVYLYPNTLQAVAITGAEVQGLAGTLGRHLQPGHAGGADQPLIDLDFPAYNFDVIDGVTYAIDVTQPSRYDADGKLVQPGRQPHRRPAVRRQADRSRRRSSSSPPTTTALAAAAASRAPTARR